MNSKNFEILRQQWPELADLGGFAERYTHTDASSALIKLRTFSEQMVEGIYRTHSLTLPYQHNLYDLLLEETFKETVPKTVLDKLHQIRLDGNKAAHGKTSNSETALESLRDAWDVGCWYFITYGNGNPDQIPQFREPPPEDSKAKVKREKKAALEQLASQEAKLQELLQQVELLRSKEKAAEIKLITNRIEDRFRKDRKRTVNIDPGYVTEAKLVLLTTKDYTHRVYIGKRIFAESTLFFQDGTFKSWPWTYPDYASAEMVSYFNQVRELYMQGTSH